MTDTPSPAPDKQSTSSEPDPADLIWDPRNVMRDRAKATRRQRDKAIADLRADMTDDEVLEEFGIDLGEIER